MRGPAAALAFGLGLGLPCLLAVGAAAFGWDVRGEVYGALAGLGFAAGLVAAAVVDGMLYKADQESQRRQRNAMTDSTVIANAAARRKVNGLPVAEPPLVEQIDRATRAREFEIAHWRVYFRRIWAAGMAYGWDIRTLTDKKRLTCVTTQSGWNLATDKLVEAGYLRKDTAGTVPLVSEVDWQAERLWEQVPCPNGEPPEILPPPYTTQQTRQQTTAKQAVIEN